MPSLDQAHNHNGLESQTHQQLPGFHPAVTSDGITTIPPLPAYTYTPPSAKRPKVFTAFEQNTPSVGSNGASRSNSPDPHEFYRPHQDKYRASLAGSSGQGDIRVEQREIGMVELGQRPNPAIARPYPPKLPQSTSRIQSRYTKSPTSDRSPLNSTRSTPALFNTARNRQTSLKDLVNKFNQPQDEALPLPRESSSRSPSANSNPGGSSNSAHVKPRKSSLSTSTGDVSGKKISATSLHSMGKSGPQPRRGRTNEDSNASPRSKRTLRTHRTEPIDSRQDASKSATDLGQHADTLPRRPLFGEILATSPAHTDPGFGIPRPRRRRGSEGSMHSPNPMFPQDRGRPIPEISPSSPSAWYLGMTPTLEEIKMERNIPDLPSNLHRRTRSDFSGAPSKPPTSKMYGTNLSPSRDPQSSSSSTTTSKRNSQSRIPVSTTRRLSTASDSGNSTQSTRAGSALGRAHIISPTRPAAIIPKHLQKPRSPPRHSRSSTPQRSPRRGDFSSGTGRPTTSPLLTAYISAPMPKKSPPLRSSRPRQPVSNASTSASRARAVERFSGHEDGNSRNTREARPRKPPELAGVDFAARRQKIQQAVTKTVKEEERKDEQRRASMALSMTREGHMSDGYPTAEESDTTGSQGGARAIEVNMGRSITQETEDDYKTPAEEDTEPEMAINTGHLPERSVLDMSMEDSPTLGTFHRFSVSLDQGQKEDESIPSDAEPSSAITAGTSDSVDTFFDDEPQDDSHDRSRNLDEQQTLLNQIITTRDPSSSPDGVRRPLAAEESVSERDDRESIQIMLGETPILENAPFREQQYEGKSKEPQLNEDPESRWSMSSWTSSNKSRDDREAPLERIDEYSPSYSAEHPHLSISTSASQQTSQLWSPQSFTSPRTARTTMDSDAYSTINRVLDHYHDPSIVSPELIQDVQQHIITQSPDLARQGGWDLKKVTALYLQERAKGSYGQPNSVPDPVRFQIRQRTSSVKIPEVSEKEVREDHDEKMLENMEREDGDPTPPGTNLSVDQGEFKPARASLTGPDDWDMSPSLGGLHLQAEAGDSPSEDKPILPPKDWQTAKKDFAEMAEEALVRQPPAHSHPQLPPIEGLAINIMPPQMEDSPAIPPPLPFHTPPPPPFDSSNPIRVRSPPSPSVYGKQMPPKALKAMTADAISPPLPDLPPGVSLHQSRSATSLIQQPSLSASMSQEGTSVDQPSTSTDAPSKNSSPSPDQKRLTRRRHIIKELVDTEHSFGQDMKVVDDIYKGTANIIVISPEDVKTLFGNSDHIVAFSTNFLDALKQGSKSVYVLARSKRWRSNRVSNATSYSGNTDDQSSLNGVELSDDEKDRKTFIGEQFQHHMESMEKVYTEYLKNHDLANQKLLALQKDLKVGIWLKECRAYAHDLTSAWNLDSLLVKPVQRILKYPLLLDQLLEVTPENHPDFKALDIAAREMKGMAKRIDEMKKRTDVMGQVINTRKRKESDVRGGLSKAFGRRTAEKLRQQVGLSDPVDDKAYSAICEKFGSHFFKLQIVMRDVERYTNDVQVFMNNFCDFASSMEAHIDVGQTNYPELESKWRKFRMSTREMSMTALTDHVAAVRKNVIEPMTTLLRLHDGPQKLMSKRGKRVTDYARFKAIKDRGDKPDKKTMEQGEQFQAINDTLKDELPKLFALTGKLVEACLNNFVQLQLQWQVIWRRKLSQALDDNKLPTRAQDIVEAFTGDFAFFEAQVLSLGVCNGSMLKDAGKQSNYISPTTTLNGDDENAARHASQSSLIERPRTLSVSSDKSPMLPQPDFGSGGGRSSGSFFPIENGMQQLAPAGNYVTTGRVRASSTLSGHSPRTPEVPGSYHSFSNSTTPVTATPGRPSIATPRTFTEPSPSISRPSIETPSISRPSEDSTRAGRTSQSTYPPSSGSSQQRDNSDPQRFSDFFNSAMPMSDSPPTQSPAPGQGQHGFNILFFAASVYEFNIDRARKEAGYPYLTYVAGEIFDVIGEKGELWLAKNQDDPDNEVGWIWNKHFVKLAS